MDLVAGALPGKVNRGGTCYFLHRPSDAQLLKGNWQRPDTMSGTASASSTLPKAGFFSPVN